MDTTVFIRANQKLLFIIDSNGTADYDATYWDPTIDYKPINATFNSSVDFSDNSNGIWSYLAETGIDTDVYTPLTWNPNTNQYELGSTLCHISSDTMHPGNENNTVRAWTAQSSGSVVISNIIKKFDVTGGDGVNLKIMKMSGGIVSKIWPQSGEWQPLSYNDAVGYSFQVPTDVNAGDTLYFVINGGALANVDYDLTYWHITIITA